ncbi:ribonuclease H-like domain-containing protein [Cellulosilyticum sp. I15G10I2]|uniref:ribonuclease H-like domain-containing protein n=1 Tax=Cellulosilyticum sp. I15G10I2 TaxID=1892843 RepID=UPI00085C0D0B|nr:ribonuclease H-like domain-containing protein [Cellulosilyticum sp. I15G10I2]
MQIIYDKFNHPFATLSNVRFLLDIETTGLSKTNDCIICIGIVYKKNDMSVSSIQWFAENRSDEVKILKSFLEFCTAYQKVYTYNGKRFDIPFILARLESHGLNSDSFKSLLFIDMKETLCILNPKRLSIENVLGYQRKTSVTGKELVSLYKLFENTQLITYQTIILNHHLEELGSLLSFYEYYNTLYQLSSCQLIEIARNNDTLQIALQVTFNFHTHCDIQLEGTSLSWQPNTSIIYLKIMLYTGVFKKFLTPAKDYYLIKGQNQLIHKSVAQFIAKDLKVKVSKKQCFVTKAGTFIRIYTPFKITFDKWYNDNEALFIEYQEDPKLITFIIQQVVYLLTTR